MIEAFSSPKAPVHVDKEEIRERVWRALERSSAALPPFPIRGRIPNFKGAYEAAMKIRTLREYEEADVVLCNPDSPQRPVRELVLSDGKILIVATPRLSRGFVMLRNVDPGRASTIKGMMELGTPVTPGSVEVDLFVAGSVAVSQSGHRLGKGTGYSDREFSIWRDAGSIDDKVLRITTVHDLQVVEEVPSDSWDIPVDVILTPTRIIWTEEARRRLGRR